MHAPCDSAKDTYRVASVALACNLALATAKLNARVLVGSAPCLPVVLGHGAGVYRAAGDGCLVLRARVLRRSKAGKSRGGDDESRVEHCCVDVDATEYQCLSGAESAGDRQLAVCVERVGKGEERT